MQQCDEGPEVKALGGKQLVSQSYCKNIEIECFLR